MDIFRKLSSTNLFFSLCLLWATTAHAEVDFATDEITIIPDSEFYFFPSSFCFPIAGEAEIALDNFRSLPEGSWEGNTGAFASLNLGTPLPHLSCYGLGVQLGGSYGVYDWPGRGYALAGNQKEVQQQGFLTLAIFRRTPCDSGINGAVAFDSMFNDNFGVFALDPYLSQIRYEVSYLFRCWDEFGLWGTIHTNTSHQSKANLPVAFRAINQISLFWRHFFWSCAETTIWAGIPYGNSLMFAERPGDFLFGASFKVPLTDCLSIEGHGMYMYPRHANGVTESKNYASNICFGLNYSFDFPEPYCASDCDYRPYLPVANNSNFITDTSLNY